MSDRLGRSCIEPIGGQVLGGGALTMLIFCFLVFMYYTLPFCCQRGVGENGEMSEPRPTLQFDLDLEAVRLLHRSVSFHLEKWPGGPDPREQEALQSMKTLLTAALLEFSLDQDGQR
jgi:hypothetical protein